jgi:hypothetical protein
MNMGEVRTHGVAQAVLIGEEMGLPLDGSPDSVQNVEKILAKHHDDFQQRQDDEGVLGLCVLFGAYIVDVIERNYGPGRWERDDPEFGENTFPYFWRGTRFSPVAWCQKRIYDGPGEDVWFKFCAAVTGPDGQLRPEV